MKSIFFAVPALLASLTAASPVAPGVFPHVARQANGTSSAGRSKPPSTGTTTLPSSVTPPPTSTTSNSLASATTETIAPGETMVIRIQVGTSTFYVGDADQSNFINLLNAGCPDGNGCTDAPQNFAFNWTGSDGDALPATGSFTLSGNADNSDQVVQSLLNALNTALLGSSSCKTVESELDCHDVSKRIVDPPTPECKTMELQQCSVISMLTATLYSDINWQSGYQMGSVTMNGASQNPAAVVCEDILNVITKVLPITPLPGQINGAALAIQAFC